MLTSVDYKKIIIKRCVKRIEKKSGKTMLTKIKRNDITVSDFITPNSIQHLIAGCSFLIP